MKALYLIGVLLALSMFCPIVYAQSSQAQPPGEVLEVSGYAAYIPFSLVIKFDLKADRGVTPHFDAIGASKPTIEAGLDSIIFKTNEVDTFTVWFTIFYSRVVNQTIWILVYSGNTETAKVPFQMYGASFSKTIRIKTGIQPSFDEQLRKYQDVLLAGLKQSTESNIAFGQQNQKNYELLFTLWLVQFSMNIFLVYSILVLNRKVSGGG